MTEKFQSSNKDQLKTSLIKNSLSKKEVSESINQFNCHEENIKIQSFDDQSLDQTSQLSLNKQYGFLNNMYKKEIEYQINPQFYFDFEKIQKDITRTMRAILIDWM